MSVAVVTALSKASAWAGIRIPARSAQAPKQEKNRIHSVEPRLLSVITPPLHLSYTPTVVQRLEQRLGVSPFFDDRGEDIVRLRTAAGLPQHRAQ